MQNSVSTKLFTDGQHSSNVIRQGDLVIGSGIQIRYPQEGTQASMHIVSIYPENNIPYVEPYLSRFIFPYLLQQRPSLRRRNRSETLLMAEGCAGTRKPWHVLGSMHTCVKHVLRAVASSTACLGLSIHLGYHAVR